MNMTENVAKAEKRIQLRKYPNRRYYDVTRRQHVTLEDIHRLVCEGYEVAVTDSKTEEDITARVLTQIVLDHDPMKLGIFPISLLHQVIRASEPLVKDFVEKYFSEAFAAFSQSQRQFDRYLREVLGLESGMALAAHWSRMMMGPLAPPFFAAAPPASSAPAPNGTPPEAADLRKLVEDLREQVESLQARIEEDETLGADARSE